MRRDDMLAVGGFHFDEFDDMDLSHRIAHAHGPAAVLYEPRAQVHHYVPPERMTWSYFSRRCFSVNRKKVAALVDMSESGNIAAELRFGVGVLLALVPALLAAVTGRPERLLRALVAVAGVALAGCGYVTGRVQLCAGSPAGHPDDGPQRDRGAPGPRCRSGDRQCITSSSGRARLRRRRSSPSPTTRPNGLPSSTSANGWPTTRRQPWNG